MEPISSQTTVDGSGALLLLSRIATVLILLFIFLLGVQGLGDGFKLLGRDVVSGFFAATENPFIALVVGILATTLVQSSSVTTSMIVGLVAAPENPLPVANAIPMVMGANIGTTVTNSVVSLAHMGRKDEFLNAFSVATCHDFFNFLTVATLLPLEMATGFLRHSAVTLSSAFGDIGGVRYESPLKGALAAALVPMKSLASILFAEGLGQAGFLIILSAMLIFTALFLLVTVMRLATRSRVEVFVNRFLDRSVLLSMLVGVIVTVMVQSSSITTSLMVPLAGAGLLTLERAFPLILGANIGTTITALLATLAVSGANAHAGVEIALIHLFFNISGILLIYPLPFIRRLPLAAAEKLAQAAVRSRKWAVLYVVGLFYGLPAALVFLDRLFD